MAEVRVEVVELDWQAVVNHLNNYLTIMGMTFNELLDCADDCGCCVTVPPNFEHISEDYLQRVWDFVTMYDLEKYYEQA